MTQEEKQLLLVDLCGRLMYGVKCKVFDFATPYTLSSISPDLYDELYFTQLEIDEGDGYASVQFCKPYLFPLSSMTEEQKQEYQYITERWMYDSSYSISDSIDWLNAHHFDFRGLIEKGLAIDTNLNIH